jgi:acyl dehydratase
MPSQPEPSTTPQMQQTPSTQPLKGVNAGFVGRSYPPTAPYAVGSAKIREFAEAVGARDAVHVDSDVARARGYADVVAPPTFAVLIAQQCDRQFVVDPEAGIDYTRVVHGEQRFVHHRPIVAGDDIVGVLTVDSVREAGGHAMVTTRSELSTVAGEPVCTATSTLVIRAGQE